MLRPALLVGGAVVLVLLLAGASYAAWRFLGGSRNATTAVSADPAVQPAGASDDFSFMPDATQMIGQVRMDQIMTSDAVKQVFAAFPDTKKGIDQVGSLFGSDLNNVDRMYFGAAKADFSAKDPPAAITVIHFKNSVKVEDIENGLKKSGSSGPFATTYTFTDTKVGKYTMTEVKSATSFNPPGGIKGAPPIPPSPPTPMFAFAMPDDKQIVMGKADALKAVLTRDKKPDVNDKLQAAIKQTDWNASIAFAANVQDGVVIPPAQAQAIPLPIEKVDGLSVSIKIATDVDVNVTALCKDAASAAELSGGVNTLLKAAAGSPQIAKAPAELKDLMNLSPQVSGSNVTIQKTIKVAPLLSLMKNPNGGLPFNPFGPAAPPPVPPPAPRPPFGK